MSDQARDGRTTGMILAQHLAKKTHSVTSGE